MQQKDWIRFKTLTEEKFEQRTIEQCWGFQIQRNTKWNNGLTINEIRELEVLLGLTFPLDYIEMLKSFNGFETLQISIDPEGKEEDVYQRRCYKYPEDVEKTKWLIEEVNHNIQYANQVLEDAGFDPKQIEGFIPLYGHRVLVVLKDKQHSPVLSVVGDDIIMYGKSLIKYWCNEFELKFKNNKPKF